MTPPNPDKQRCAIPGCQAWAMRGHDYCVSHLRKLRAGLRDPRTGEEGELLASLARAMDMAARRPELSDLDVIDEELRTLYAVRSLFLAWMKERQGLGAPDEEPPTRFMRAWNDSTTRVMQLLRARRELGGGAESPFDALMARVRDRVDEILAEAAQEE